LDSDLDCQAVVFFYRINRMLELSCNALRQQVVNTEQKRLEKEVKVCRNFFKILFKKCVFLFQ